MCDSSFHIQIFQICRFMCMENKNRSLQHIGDDLAAVITPFSSQQLYGIPRTVPISTTVYEPQDSPVQY